MTYLRNILFGGFITFIFFGFFILVTINPLLLIAGACLYVSLLCLMWGDSIDIKYKFKAIENWLGQVGQSVNILSRMVKQNGRR